MEYALAVLTHGRASTLDEALGSFHAHVTPAPAQVLVYSDGGSDLRAHEFKAWPPRGTLGREGRPQSGFCRATAALWRWATESDIPYVFWLEHDFVFTRRVELRELAGVLDSERSLAQMALMRTAVSDPEVAAGGLFASRRGEYEPRVWLPSALMDTAAAADAAREWQQHRSYFTTNPSLMRRDFMVANPWPDDGAPNCEGRFGIELVRRGYHFGVWGDGSPWVEHVGIRSGFGY